MSVVMHLILHSLENNLSLYVNLSLEHIVTLILSRVFFFHQTFSLFPLFHLKMSCMVYLLLRSLLLYNQAILFILKLKL